MISPIEVSGDTAASTAILAGAVASGASYQISTAMPNESLVLVFILAVIGLVVGLGHALSSKEELPVRRVIGKTLVSVAVSVTAAGMYYFKPDSNPLVIIGVGSLLSVLGAGWLEGYVKERFKVKKE